MKRLRPKASGAEARANLPLANLGETVKLIPLTQGQFAKVSDHRYAELSKHKWAARWCASMNSYYAQRSIYPGGRKGKKTIQMHRVILGYLPNDKQVGDHRNGDTLDNRDCNLRHGKKGNPKSRRLNKNSTSGLKGVTWRKDAGKWIAQIANDGKRTFLGYFTNKRKAHAAYRKAAVLLHGEFAKFK